MTATTTTFNVFQRLTRKWDVIHPYNAAQAIRVQGAPDVDALDAAWREAMAQLFAQPQREAPLVVLPADACIDAHLSHELNRSFAAGESPYRPFVIRQDGSYLFGVVYHHWVADSVSIRQLLREWFYRLYDPARARRQPFPTSSDGYWRLFGPQRGKWHLGEGLLASARWSSRLKRARRVDARSRDQAVSFSLTRAPHGLISRVREATRAVGVSVHDVLLAALAEACDRHLPMRYVAHRQDVALGSIVDLRPMADHDLSETWGMFLGFSSVSCRPRDLRHWPRLVETVVAQGRLQKQTGMPQASLLRMSAALTLELLLPRDRLMTFYRKRVPLAGGISNVNLSCTWAAEYHPSPIVEYIRASPTGPTMPLVVTTSTLGETFQLGLTRRAAIVSDAAASGMMEMMLSRLHRVAGD